jgi:valyl-tRNA synthetase
LRVLELFRAHQETILRLAAFQALNFVRGRLSADTVGVRATPHFDVRVFHEVEIDRDTERARLLKEKERLEKGLAGAEKQLENQEFMSRAPQEVVRNAEKRHAEVTAQLRRILDSLERLGYPCPPPSILSRLASESVSVENCARWSARAG